MAKNLFYTILFLALVPSWIRMDPIVAAVSIMQGVLRIGGG